MTPDLRDKEVRERLLAEAWAARAMWPELTAESLMCQWDLATAIAALELIGELEGAVHAAFNGRHECTLDPEAGPLPCRVCEAEAFLGVRRTREEGDVAF